MKSLAAKIAERVMDLAERERCLNKDHLISAIETELLADKARPPEKTNETAGQSNELRIFAPEVHDNFPCRPLGDP